MKQSRKHNLTSYTKPDGSLDFNNVARDKKQRKLITNKDE